MLVATKMAKVILLSHSPFQVDFLQISRSSFFGPFPDTFVKQAIRSIGLVSETTGYFSHQIQAEVVGALPQWIVDLILTKNTLAMRGAALRKRAKQQ